MQKYIGERKNTILRMMLIVHDTPYYISNVPASIETKYCFFIAGMLRTLTFACLVHHVCSVIVEEPVNLYVAGPEITYVEPREDLAITMLTEVGELSEDDFKTLVTEAETELNKVVALKFLQNNKESERPKKVLALIEKVRKELTDLNVQYEKLRELGFGTWVIPTSDQKCEVTVPSPSYDTIFEQIKELPTQVVENTARIEKNITEGKEVVAYALKGAYYVTNDLIRLMRSLTKDLGAKMLTLADSMRMLQHGEVPEDTINRINRLACTKTARTSTVKINQCEPSTTGLYCQLVVKQDKPKGTVTPIITIPFMHKSFSYPIMLDLGVARPLSELGLNTLGEGDTCITEREQLRCTELVLTSDHCLENVHARNVPGILKHCSFKRIKASDKPFVHRNGNIVYISQTSSKPMTIKLGSRAVLANICAIVAKHNITLAFGDAQRLTFAGDSSLTDEQEKVKVFAYNESVIALFYARGGVDLRPYLQWLPDDVEEALTVTAIILNIILLVPFVRACYRYFTTNRTDTDDSPDPASQRRRRRAQARQHEEIPLTSTERIRSAIERN